jgi:uncharacterized protein YyaL (SSP411 family)
MLREQCTLKTVSLLILCVLFTAPSLHGRSIKPDSAQSILHAAIAQAQSSNTNVLLIFHASWCKWCKRLESALSDSTIKPLIDKNYTVAMLDVKERGDKIQAFENPGGQKLMSDFGGDSSGLPFIVFLNGKGKMIANSNVMPNKQNIGYPGSKKEIAAFVKLFKKTAPQITSKQIDVMRKYFQLHAPQ